MAHELKVVLNREEDSSYKELYTNIANKLEKIFLGVFGNYPWFKGVKFNVVEEMERLEVHGSLFIENEFDMTEIDNFLLANPYEIPNKLTKHLNYILNHFNKCFILNPDDYSLDCLIEISFKYREVFNSTNDQPLGKIDRLRSDYIEYINKYYLRALDGSNTYKHIREQLKDLTIVFSYCDLFIGYKQSFDISFEEEIKELEIIQSLLQLLNTIYCSSKHNSILFHYLS